MEDLAYALIGIKSTNVLYVFAIWVSGHFHWWFKNPLLQCLCISKAPRKYAETWLFVNFQGDGRQGNNIRVLFYSGNLVPRASNALHEIDKMSTINHHMIYYLCHLLQGPHNERHGVSNHQQIDWLLKHLFRRTWKKTSKLRVNGLCEESISDRWIHLTKTSNAENVSIWWRYHAMDSYRASIVWNLKYDPGI